MNNDSRLAVAIHILALLALTREEYQTSELLARSVNTNPVVIRRLTGLLKKAGWLEVRPEAALVSLTVTDRAHWISEYYPVRSVERFRRGWRVQLLVADPAWLRSLLLRLGPEVRAVDPPEAAESARAAASEALELYAELGSGSVSLAP